MGFCMFPRNTECLFADSSFIAGKSKRNGAAAPFLLRLCLWFYVGKQQIVIYRIPGHCEPARRLQWQSPESKFYFSIIHRQILGNSTKRAVSITMVCPEFDGDSHTRKADWFGMTMLFDSAASLCKLQFISLRSEMNTVSALRRERYARHQPPPSGSHRYCSQR